MSDENTEKKILAAARKIFLLKGMDGARMQDIADEAGINKAMLHYYFRSKEKLFEMIFRDVASGLFPRLSEIFQSADSLYRKIERFAEVYIDQMKATPYLPGFIMGEINRQPEQFLKQMWPAKKPPIHLFVATVQEEIKAGRIKPVNPMQLLMNMISLCIFPFAARPIFQHFGGLDQSQFDELMEMRKKEIPRFVIDAIKI